MGLPLHTVLAGGTAGVGVGPGWKVQEGFTDFLRASLLPGCPHSSSEGTGSLVSGFHRDVLLRARPRASPVSVCLVV